MLFATILPQADQPDQYRTFNPPLPNFAALAHVLSKHSVINYEGENGKTPKTMPCFSPAEFDGQADPRSKTIPQKFSPYKRGTSNENVLRIHFGVLDFDGVSPERFAQVLDRFARVEGIVYSTFSHGKPGGGRWRLVVPFSRPVSRAEWDAVWYGLYLLSDRAADETCNDPRRIYFLPVAHASRHADARFLYWSGEPAGSTLDVDELLRRGQNASRLKEHAGRIVQHEDLDVEAFKIEDLAEHISSLMTRRSAHTKRVGMDLKKILAGEVFETVRGERNKTLFKLIASVAEGFPNASPESVAEVFRKSLVATATFHREDEGHAETVDIPYLIDRFTKKASEKLADLAAKADEMHATRTQHIREAFSALDLSRETPYTPEELLGFAETSRVTIKDLKKRWIIAHGQSCYLWVDGQYMPSVGIQNLSQVAKRDLAPAYTAGVEIGDDEGLKPPTQLLTEYGTIARRCRVDLTATTTHYLPDEQCIVEATCPLRPLVPERVLWIEAWLKLLGGEKEELLLDWISVVTRLDRAATILYLRGQKGSGKNLLADGLARLWVRSGGCTDMATLFGNWNDPVTRCPLVVADEKLPDALKTGQSAALRAAQQDMRRNLRRRFHDEAEMVGALRMIILANNRNVLATDEDLTTDDIDAFVQRVLYIEIPRCEDNTDPLKRSPAAMYLHRLATETDCDPQTEILKNDALAKHALWLRDTRGAAADRGRFFVHDTTRDLENCLTVQTGIRWNVCQWIVMWLQAREAQEQFTHDGVLVWEGRLYVAIDCMVAYWDNLLSKIRTPSTATLARALEGVSDGPARTLPLKGKRTLRPYYAVRPELLAHWARETGFTTEAEIRRALMRNSKIAFDTETAQVYNVTPPPPLKKPAPEEFGLYGVRKGQ